MKHIPKRIKKASARKQNRCLTRQLARFLKKQGFAGLLELVNLLHKRKKIDSGASFLLQFLLAKIWRIGSAYATNISVVPKNALNALGITRFPPHSTFYDEIPSINQSSLENFNDKIIQKAIKDLETIIVMLDGHAMELWSKNYALAAWGASSSEHKFFGYKLLATIIHGLDVVVKHLLVAGNHSATPFAQSILEQTLSITGRIDVLLMDREFTDFTFWAWLILQKIGFIIPAKDDNAVTKTIRRTFDVRVFKKLGENTEYFESLAYFPDLRENLRVIFIKKKIDDVIKEYELITNLPAEYSTIEVIKLYPLRQGREDVFDRLKNEFDLHKPCKIKNFAGIEAFVGLTCAAYNLYALFSNTIYGRYRTVVILYREWLFNEVVIPEIFSIKIPVPDFLHTPSANSVQP